MRPSMRAVTSPQYRTLLVRLTAARRHAKMGQATLARRLHRPQSFVSKYEHGERRLDVIELLEILRILRVHPCTFIKGL